MQVIQFSFCKLNAILNRLGTLLFCLVAVVLSFSVMVRAIYDGSYVEVMAAVDTPVIVLDAGHGGEDVGAIGTNGVYEKDLNLSYTFTLGQMLTDEGYTVFYTRTTDRLLYSEEENIKGMRKIYDLKNRASIVNEKSPIMFISIHMNHFSIEKYRGLEVYFRDGDTDSQRLAYDIANEVRLGADPENTRTPKATEDLYLLNNVACPSVLIECGFLSNENECDKLCEKEYEKQLCFSIICGMIKYESRNRV